MQIPIIPIGNSKGIRIPKVLLDQLNIKTSMELEVEDGKIVLTPTSINPRAGWQEAFQQSQSTEGAVWGEMSNDFDDQDWQW